MRKSTRERDLKKRMAASSQALHAGCKLKSFLSEGLFDRMILESYTKLAEIGTEADRKATFLWINEEQYLNH